MKLSEQSQLLLVSVLQTLVDRYGTECAEPVLTDFHFYPSQETGDLTVTDDEGSVISRVNIVEWCENTATDDEDLPDFLSIAQQHLADAIARFDADGALQRLNVWKPYSLVLVDDDYETVSDLLLVDDDTLILTDNLLQNLDEDLNAFLENLLADDK